MKLEHILEDWTNYHAPAKVASGGDIMAISSRVGFDGDVDNTQKQFEKEFLESVYLAGEKGYKPKEELSYTLKNKLRVLINKDMVIYKDGRFYITDLGKTWFEAFDQDDKQELFSKQMLQATGGSMTGIATS
jgi:hypothetical protein